MKSLTSKTPAERNAASERRIVMRRCDHLQGAKDRHSNEVRIDLANGCRGYCGDFLDLMAAHPSDNDLVDLALRRRRVVDQADPEADTLAIGLPHEEHGFLTAV